MHGLDDCYLEIPFHCLACSHVPFRDAGCGGPGHAASCEMVFVEE